MTHPDRESYIALLTPAEVGVRLHLTLPSVDHLVEIGELCPVHVSQRGTYRFWPDEIMAYGLRESMKAGTREPAQDLDERTAALLDNGRSAPAVSDSAPRLPPRGEGRRNRPAWAPFTGPTERGPSYLAFADRDHVINYLRSRENSRAHSSDGHSPLSHPTSGEVR